MKNIFLYLSGFIVMLLNFQTTAILAENPIIIKGRIIDKHKSPISFATVYITISSNTTAIIKGGISNDQGIFSLQAGKNQSYLLKITSLGYKEYSLNIRTDSTNLNLGDVILEEASYKMSEVVVKPPLQVTANKIIYNFENDPDRTNSNLHDMLSKMPMIIVGPHGKISVGSEEKTYIVLRKGREDALVNFQNISFEEMLKRLPAMGFTSFEIWTVVPPKYSKYDYVINILPDPTQRLFGVVGSPEIYYNFDAGELRTGMGGNGSADIFRVTGGIKYQYIDAPKQTRQTNTVFFTKDDDSEVLFTQNEKYFNTSDIWQGNLSASLDISKRQFITFKLNISFQDAKNHRQIAAEQMTSENQLSQSISNYKTNYKTDRWNVGATYQLDFLKPERILNISYLCDLNPSRKHDNREINYTLGTSSNEKNSAHENIKNQTHRIQFDYYDQFFKNKLLFNAQTGYLLMDYCSEGKNLNELTNTEDTNLFNRFEQNFHRLDGFVNFSYNVNKRLNITTKVDADFLPDYNKTTSITGNFEENIRQKKLLFNIAGKLFYQFTIAEHKKKEEKSFDEMTPEEKIAFISKNMGAGKSLNDITNNSSTILPNSSIRFDYTYRQRRPGNSQLTNYSDERDPLYSKRGNPNLQSEAYHIFAIRFSSWFINSFSTLFSFSNNKIVSQTKKEGDKLLQSFYNSGKTRDFNIGLTHSFLKNKISISPYFSSSYTDFGDGNWKKQEKLNLGARYNLTISNINVTPELNYYKTFNHGAMGEKDVFPLNLSLGAMWTPKIYGKEIFIIAGANNILQWKRQTRLFADMTTYRQYEKTAYHSFPLYLSVRITLGKFKVKPVKTTKSTANINGFSTDKE